MFSYEQAISEITPTIVNGKNVYSFLVQTGIDTGAEVNVIETIEINNVALTPTDKKISFSVPTSESDIGALPDTTKYEATPQYWRLLL